MPSLIFPPLHSPLANNSLFRIGVDFAVNPLPADPIYVCFRAIPFSSSLSSLSDDENLTGQEIIVCIKPELFCRPFPTVNSL